MIIKLAIAVITLLILGGIIYSILGGTTPNPQTTEIPKASDSPNQTDFTDIKIDPSKIKQPPEPILVDLFTPGRTAATGYVRLSEITGKTLIQLKSDLPDSNIASIYKGTCKETGKTVYPLVTLKAGKSQTIWETKIESIKTQLPLSVKVFKDQKSLQTFISCADIK